ncbi:hypothetical protein GCM10011491_46820 [Brucella endophytica]|uniref:Uncharacterized protein n=1 Tax=Brucella endophytica TaxID=1963359 RepID=A0A916SS67_9HYPH|nr:hypothetical protein [Brucella endophytica]GGB13786.1 hypothetical protein GCM10011491_46820 [Brucella endophytica]
MEYPIYWSAAFPGSIDTRGWMPPLPVPSATTGADPALVEFNKQLWCVHNDGNSNLMAHCYNLGAWQGPHPMNGNAQNNQTNYRAALTVFDETLYCMYADMNDSAYYTSSTDGEIWTPANKANGLGTALRNGLGVVAYDGTVHGASTDQYTGKLWGIFSGQPPMPGPGSLEGIYSTIGVAFRRPGPARVFAALLSYCLMRRI